MKRKLLFVYFIILITVIVFAEQEIHSELKTFNEHQEATETQKLEQNDYDFVLISPLNNSEDISIEGTEIVWKVYIKGTTLEATDLLFQVYLSPTMPPKDLINDSSGNNIFATTKIHSGILEPGSTYYWQVIAKDKDGKIFESEIWNFKTRTKAMLNESHSIKNAGKIVPISPTNESKQSNKNIYFSWELQNSDYTDATYTLLIDQSKDFPKPFFIETKARNYSFKGKLEKSTTYFWKVIAKFENAEVIESEPFIFTTISSSSPVFLEATPSNEASVTELTGIKFTWNFLDIDGDILTYDYYLYESTITERPLWSKTFLLDNSLILTEKLKYGETYFWKVIAKDEDNNVVESPTYKFITPPEKIVENFKEQKRLPEITEISPKEGERISYEKKISWKYSEPLTDDLTVELLITKDKASTPLTIPISKDTTEYKIDPKLLEKDQTYYWKIKISDSEGISYEHGWYTFLTQLPTVPSTPNLLFPENNAEINPSKITLKWTNSVDEDEDILTYTVLLGEKPDNLFVIAENLEKTEFEIPNLQREKTYYWKVIVSDEDNNKVESKVSRFTTKLLSDIYILNPKNNILDVPVRNIKFEWEDEKVEGVKYIFRIGESKDKMSALPFEISENYYLLQTKLKYDTTYYWRIDRRYQGKIIQGETYQFKTVKLPKPEKLNPVGVNTSTKNLVLSWEYPLLEAEKITFDIYLSTDNTNLRKIAENVISPNYMIPFRLEKEKIYYWKVVAKNDYGVSSESEIAKFETVPQTLPLKPEIIEPLCNASGVDFDNVTLSWNCKDPDDDKLKFLVLLDTVNPPQRIETETEDTRFVVQKLLPDTQYFWQIIVIDEESGYVVSDISSFTTTKIIFYEDFEKKNYTLQNASTKGSVRIIDEPKRGRVLELKADHNSSSEFSFEINLPIEFTLKFEYLVSSEEKYDLFLVYVNNKEVYRDSGIKEWNVFETKLEPGQYNIKLVYKKDRIKYQGRDCVLIDNIVVK